MDLRYILEEVSGRYNNFFKFAMKKTYSFLSLNIALLTLGFVVYVLYIGASIIIPFVVAVLLSFIVISLTKFYCSL